VGKMFKASTILKICFLLVFISLMGCVTPYQSSGIIGGYSEKQISPTVWRITFDGNGYTSRETVQTYWLYRAAELTLQKGYDSFEVLNSLMSGMQYWKDGYDPKFVAQVIYMPMESNKPVLELDIRLHKEPYAAKPPKSFNAKKLMASIESYVKGAKCGGNVCPHEKLYMESNN